MRLLLTADTVGGVWDYALTLAREVAAGGHEVLLAVVGRVDGARLARLPDGVRVVAREYRLEWMPDSATDVAAAGEWLAETARAWRADVVHLNQMAYAVHDFGAPTLVVVHSDVLSWLGETLGAAPGPEWTAYAEVVRRGVAAADVLVTPSAYQSALTAHHYGRGADVVIHNGASAPRAAPVPGPGAPLAITAGRAWDRAKGMAVVDRAAALLEGEPAVHLFGEETGPGGERFEAGRLVRHGRCERAVLEGWMRRATLYVGASLYEPFGLAPLEAALHGCALVLSDIGSFRELWDGAASFVPRGDAAALAAAIAELAADPARTAALARAAGERARERYAAARFAAAYLALYARMAGSRGARPAFTRLSEAPCA